MPKAARAYWKGFLRLSLVTIGVEIYNAVESKADISFRQIHKPSGKRVNYEKVVAGIGKIDTKDIVKGYEVDKDTYVTLDPEEIDAVKLESKKTIDLVQFVDAGEIDYRYFERPYFVAPTDELSGEGYVVIREALRRTGKVGLSQVTISGREWLVAIAPLEDGLVMEMLRYAGELRQPADFFDEVPGTKPDREMVDLAVQLIEKKSGPFKPEKFEDHYASALKALIQDKLKGRKIVAHETERPSGGNIVDLMEALRKSVGAAPAKGGSTKTGSSAPAKPKSTRRTRKRA
ncbi:non-homologous end joining protein Ku [Hyphomicrobium sp.]|uniref:non-homologous end joining protein Ku n=1 Tax=Hyphomicrobium sp. TaxID=82 RepID=UPI002FDE692B